MKSIKAVLYTNLKKLLPSSTGELLRQLIYPLRYSTPVSSDELTVIDPAHFLSKQFVNDRFNRFDLIVINLAIGQYFGNNDYGYKLYEKMQQKRMLYRGDKNDRHNVVDEFIILLKQINKYGFNWKSQITLDKNYKICDGAHRASCLLYFGYELMPIRKYRKNKRIFYGIDFFRKYQFTEKEIALIEKEKERLMFMHGLYFPVIVLPPLASQANDIKSYLLSKYTIVKTDELNSIGNKGLFLKELFQLVPTLSKCKTETSSNSKEYSNTVSIIYLYIPELKSVRNYTDNNWISCTTNLIKEEIMKLGNSKSNQFYIGDDYRQNRMVFKLIQKYKNQ
jgi:hypothetical protein